MAGSEAVAPHTYFQACGWNFCGREILDHEERYVFTILFFPGLGRGLDPEWCWLSVTCNFPLMKKACNFACWVFFLCDTGRELCLSAGRTVSCQSCLPATKGKRNATLSPGWLRVASQAHRFSKLSRRAWEAVTSSPQEPPNSMKQCVLKSDKQCVTLWRYVKKKQKKNNWLLWKNDSYCLTDAPWEQQLFNELGTLLSAARLDGCVCVCVCVFVCECPSLLILKCSSRNANVSCLLRCTLFSI